MTALDPFQPEKWWSRRDRSREPLWDHTDLVGMFGMAEIECGVADIMNKARANGCALADVRFEQADLTRDSDAFRELLANGWLIAIDGRYRLDGEAVQRVHRRYASV
jgi:hypothetical protein